MIGMNNHTIILSICQEIENLLPKIKDVTEATSPELGNVILQDKKPITSQSDRPLLFQLFFTFI